VNTKAPVPKSPAERRSSRRNPIHVRVNLSDTRGSFTGRSVDVSRGGLFVLSRETRRVGTLLRIRVLGTHGESVLAVGVVVRCFADLEASSEGGPSPAMAIALTSTSEAWDRFWDDVDASDEDASDDSGEGRGAR
jgi:molecular chaperone DnaK